MRRRMVLAGLSAATLLPIVAGARFLEARTQPWPPPMITVTPGAARLADTVTADDLSSVILSRMRRFRTEPVWGHRDASGKDRLNAWTWTYLARAAVRVYRLNHDRRLIEAILTGADAYEAAARRHQAQQGFGWFTEDTQAAEPYREVPVTGLIMAPMIELLLEARRDPELEKLVGSRRQALLSLLNKAITGLDQRYREADGKGYFLLPSGHDVEPLNLMSVYARPLLGYWQLTGDPESLRETLGVARTWKAALAIASDGSVTWPHTPRPGSLAALPATAELTIKASAAVDFPLAAYEAGLVFNRAEIEAIARIPLTTLMERVDDGHYRLREFVDTSSDHYVETTGTDLGPALRPAAWYQYQCYASQLNGVLDPYLFGIDPHFYRVSNLALLGLTQRLTISQGPEACGATRKMAQLGAN